MIEAAKLEADIYPAGPRGLSAYDIYKKEGGQLSEEEWLKSLNGLTPTIGKNGNWFLGTVDTGLPSRGPKGDTGSIKFIVVTELPTENIDETAIYMKPAKNSTGENNFEELIYVNGKWEDLGTPSVGVDLSNYYTKEESDKKYNYATATVTGAFIKIKDAEEGNVKEIAVKSGTPTKIIRVGSNFFDGILAVGFYSDENLNISPNALFRSFTINLPRGSYTLCFDKSVAIIKRKINNEFIIGNVEDIKTYGFILTNDGNVSFSFRNYDRSNWSNNQKVWIIRGSENMVYSEYNKQEVSIEKAGTLTLLNGENNIFTDVDNAKLELTYTPNQILYMKNLIQNNSINHIVGLIRSGEITKIKVIGDSITHGVGGTGFQQDYGDGNVICIIDAKPGLNGVSFKVNTKGECWANSFKKYIETKYPYVTVNCWGTRGMSAHSWLTTGHTENNVFKNCLEQLITDEDELVICMIGTNDRSQGANIEEFALNMTTVINYILGKGKKLLLMSSLPASLSNENNGTQHFHMEDVNNLLCNFANNYNLWFVSLYNEVNKYLRNSKTSLNSILGDGLHPNDEGYDLMYKLLLEALGFGVPTK